MKNLQFGNLSKIVLVENKKKICRLERKRVKIKNY